MEYTSQETPKYIVDENVVKQKVESLKQEQSIVGGIVGGAFGGLIGAVVWAAFTYFTKYQVGWLSVGVGFLVGYGVKLLGKGFDKSFGILGSVIAFVSLVFGNFLVSLGYLAKFLEISYLEMILTFKYSMTFQLLAETFSIMDILFYGIAIYEGYRFSFRTITKQQLLEGALVEVK
jgi:hypothetical protein